MNLKKINNILNGGDNNNEFLSKMPSKSLELFFSIIILGYFGIKIVYGLFFHYYPEKYYYRNIEITSNEKDMINTENITLNAYVPSVWNNEITDFITLIVLSFIIYVYTNVSEKSIINTSGNISFSFILGYILGLGYPVIYNYHKNILSEEFKTATFTKLIYLVFLIAIIISVIVLNYLSADTIEKPRKMSYLLYITVIILLIAGLYISKKSSKFYSSVTYFYNNGEDCSFNKYGLIESSGELLNISTPFIVFILLLLFSYEPVEISMRNIYTFIYGLLLGILVSGISYYGIEYFLTKVPEKRCQTNDISTCTIKEIPIPSQTKKHIPSEELPEKNMITDANLKGINSRGSNPFNFLTNRNSLLNIALIFAIIIIAVYLIYYNVRSFV